MKAAKQGKQSIFIHGQAIWSLVAMTMTRRGEVERRGGGRRRGRVYGPQEGEPTAGLCLCRGIRGK
jgi:hypothetical protein